MDPTPTSDPLDPAVEGAYYVDRERRITFWSAEAVRISGFGADEVTGRRCSAGILRHVDDKGTELCVDGCPLQAVMADGVARTAAVWLHHKDGHRVAVEVTGQAVRDDEGRIIGSVELFHQVPTTRFAASAVPDVRLEAYTDAATGLATRTFGEGTLRALLDPVATGATTLGVLYVDVDETGLLNASYGFEGADAALRMVAQSIAGGLREGDIPYRHLGQEFVCLLPSTSPEDVAALAERIRMLVERSWLTLPGQRIRATISVGATMAVPGEDERTVLDRGERLARQSKSAGRNRVTTDAAAPE